MGVKVSFSRGCKINLGNYQTYDLHVGIEQEVDTTSPVAYDAHSLKNHLSGLTNDWLKDEYEKIKQMNKKGGTENANA